MNSGRIRCELAVVAVLCALMIFLSPTTQGPYSVVHGPGTAFQAAQAAARLRTAIVQGALICVANYLISPLVVLSWMSFSNTEFQLVGLPEYNIVLRC